MFYFEHKDDFPEWQIGTPVFAEGTETGDSNSLSFSHGSGRTAADKQNTRVRIYGLPSNETSSSTAIPSEACYSNGGKELGTLSDGNNGIKGLNITDYTNTVAGKVTSFQFTFDKDINENDDLYYGTDLDDGNSELAKVRFCVLMELLRANTTEITTANGGTQPDGGDVVVNYAEFAFGYDATLNGTIVLADAFEVKPAEPTAGKIADDTFTVVASVCGPQKALDGDVLNQGDSVHICITSTSFPEASISGIDTLSYSAPLSLGAGNVVLAAIVEGQSDDLLTKFDDTTDCNGEQCIVKTQLQGNFYPPNGFMNVTITGKATMELGGRRVLAEVVAGDRSLQEGSSQSGF